MSVNEEISMECEEAKQKAWTLTSTTRRWTATKPGKMSNTRAAEERKM